VPKVRPLRMELVDDIWLRVLQFLKLRSVASAAIVCQSWRGAVYASRLWRLLHDRRWASVVVCRHPPSFVVSSQQCRGVTHTHTTHHAECCSTTGVVAA
jgi:hypothetical protein